MPLPHAEDQVLVLAAGQGARMGVPKALMDVGGRPWWRVQSARLETVGLPVTWVVSEEVARAIEGAPPGEALRLIRADSDAPMFESLMIGMRALEPSQTPPRGVFVLPVDVPAPLREVWGALAGSMTPAVPEFEGQRGHPVYLPWAWVRERLLGVALPPESRRLNALLVGEARAVAVDDRHVVTNLNTPEDVSRWMRLKEA